MESEQALVTFTGVQKTYDGHTLVVKDLNLNIRKGEFLSLLGPSGSGKTTTLMMLAGFESPTSGDIMLNGRQITSTPPHKRNFGMVFQNYALFPHMTVAENIAYPLTVRKVPKAELDTKVKRALDMVQMGHMGSRYPSQMSGGQQQRVALARSLVADPEILLLDEVTSALDPELVGEVLSAIRDLAAEGMTIVMATHEMGFAREVAHRIDFLHQGKVLESGPPSQVLKDPVEERTRKFLKRVIEAGRL
jgi:putative spermidine/putrescine transport system ATP-binding protein